MSPEERAAFDARDDQRELTEWLGMVAPHAPPPPKGERLVSYDSDSTEKGG